MSTVKAVNPYLLEIDVTKAQGELTKLEKQKEATYNLFINANARYGSVPISNVKELKSAKKELADIEKLYKDIILKEEQAIKNLKVLQKELKISVSLHGDDSRLFDSLQGIDANATIMAHQKVNKKMEKLQGHDIAVKRINETAIDTIKYEDANYSRTKKDRKEAEKNLKLALMSPEDRLEHTRNNRKQLFKKVMIGGGVVGIGSAFFIPVLATPFIFIGTVGAVGFSTFKIAEKAGVVKKDDYLQLTRAIQEYAYAPQQIALQPQNQEQYPSEFGGY